MVHWVDLFSTSAGWGLACVTEGAGGYDALGSTLRVTVLRSPRVADHGLGWGDDDRAGYPVSDQGRHQRRYRLVPHLGPAHAAQLPRRAAEHRVELPVVLDTWHTGGSAPRVRRAHRRRRDRHARPQTRRGRRRHRRPPVGGCRPARARPALLGLGRVGTRLRLEGELRPHEVRTIFIPDNDPAGSADGGHPRARRAATGPVRLRRPPRTPSGPVGRRVPGEGCAHASDPHYRGRRHHLRRRERRQRG